MVTNLSCLCQGFHITQITAGGFKHKCNTVSQKNKRRNIRGSNPSMYVCIYIFFFSWKLYACFGPRYHSTVKASILIATSCVLFLSHNQRWKLLQVTSFIFSLLIVTSLSAAMLLKDTTPSRLAMFM